VCSIGKLPPKVQAYATNRVRDDFLIKLKPARLVHLNEGVVVGAVAALVIIHHALVPVQARVHVPRSRKRVRMV